MREVAGPYDRSACRGRYRIVDLLLWRFFAVCTEMNLKLWVSPSCALSGLPVTSKLSLCPSTLIHINVPWNTSQVNGDTSMASAVENGFVARLCQYAVAAVQHDKRSSKWNYPNKRRIPIGRATLILWWSALISHPTTPSQAHPDSTLRLVFRHVNPTCALKNWRKEKWWKMRVEQRSGCLVAPVRKIIQQQGWKE